MIETLEKAQRDPKYLDAERLGKLDTYFRTTGFFSRFHEQTDTQAVNECYKQLKMSNYRKG